MRRTSLVLTEDAVAVFVHIVEDATRGPLQLWFCRHSVPQSLIEEEWRQQVLVASLGSYARLIASALTARRRRRLTGLPTARTTPHSNSPRPAGLHRLLPPD